jgi:hypothetical protein
LARLLLLLPLLLFPLILLLHQLATAWSYGAVKIKQLLNKKLKQDAKDQSYKFAVDVASETTKKILLGGMES